MSTSITVFDGAKCIGGNKIFLEFEGTGIFLDFGINYKKTADFFEEFLRPRSSRGIHDLIRMGLIPNIRSYRQDMIPSDVNLASALDLKVDAALLSHAHLDHVGYTGLLDIDIPFVTTPMSAVIMKAMCDCSSGIEYETAYITPKVHSSEDSRLIRTSDYRRASYQGRQFLVTNECTDALEEFWKACPSSREYHPGELSPATSLDLELRCFEVDHSIYGAAAYAINTSVGWVVYTGDLRTHGKFKEKTERFVKAAESLAPKLLITEGTRINRQDRDESEEEVYATCLEPAMAEENLIIADFSPRNLERLDTFIEIANNTERTLVVLTKDAYLLEAIKCIDHTDRLRDLQIYSDLKLTRNRYEREIRTEFADQLLDPNDIGEAPENYILCLSFWDMKHLLDIKPEGGTYIYSSSEAYTEEQVIDFRRLWNWLKFFNFTVKGFNIIEKGGRILPEFEEGYHASGHISAEGLLQMIHGINPEIVIPVHTENPEFFNNLKEYRVILPEEGQKFELN
ncbi:MAG: MBL fold metallo-hydrolase RNA specificity domain-containing protein [Candidatus Heimdallarchaeota archaeon]